MIRLIAALLFLAPSPLAAHPETPLWETAWLEGHWVTQFSDGTVAEEVWLAPEGKTMTGLFRLAGDKGFRVAELLIIDGSGEVPTLRFKHFNADYTSWERATAITLVLTKATTEKLVFTAVTDSIAGDVDRLVYTRKGSDTLTATVHFTDGNAFPLTFTRKR